MLRTITGVIIGYLIFAGTAALLFQLTHQKPHAPATMGFMATSIAYGVAFALLAGYIATAVARRKRAATAVGVIIALGAIISLIAEPAAAKWSPVAALVLMAPAAMLGGALRRSPKTGIA